LEKLSQEEVFAAYGVPVTRMLSDNRVVKGNVQGMNTTFRQTLWTLECMLNRINTAIYRFMFAEDDFGYWITKLKKPSHMILEEEDLFQEASKERIEVTLRVPTYAGDEALMKRFEQGIIDWPEYKNAMEREIHLPVTDAYGESAPRQLSKSTKGTRKRSKSNNPSNVSMEEEQL